MRSPPEKPSLEFVALVALLTALVALSIDTMLPALGQIADDLGADADNARQFVVLALFAGLGVGQLLYGPLSDRIGRKPAILTGLAIFGAGSLLCHFASDYTLLLLGRAIQGFGAAGPRIVAVAMVRDGRAGRAMARVMSLVASVFIIVPMAAPALGQAVLRFTGWRTIFLGFFAVAVIAAVWLIVRQPETLPAARRRAIGMRALAEAAAQVLGHRVSLGFTLAAGGVLGAMIGYIGTAQQVFVEQYDQGALLALWFAVIAGAMGAASLLNARLVMRWGMRRLVAVALWGFVTLAAGLLGVSLSSGGHPPLAVYVAVMIPMFCCMGLLFGNCNALAMEPMGPIAGMAASVIGTLTSLVSVVIGTLIGQAYDGTLVPIAAGFLAAGVAALISTLTLGRADDSHQGVGPSRPAR